MLEKFVIYLIYQGYQEYTPSGHPSTAYDYSRRVLKVCEREGISLESLKENIALYIDKYDTFGSEAEFGSKSHRAVINALKRFGEFVNKPKSSR